MTKTKRNPWNCRVNLSDVNQDGRGEVEEVKEELGKGQENTHEGRDYVKKAKKAERRKSSNKEKQDRELSAKHRKQEINCHRGFLRPQWQICGRKICPFPQFTANFITFHEKS